MKLRQLIQGRQPVQPGRVTVSPDGEFDIAIAQGAQSSAADRSGDNAVAPIVQSPSTGPLYQNITFICLDKRQGHIR